MLKSKDCFCGHIDIVETVTAGLRVTRWLVVGLRHAEGGDNIIINQRIVRSAP